MNNSDLAFIGKLESIVQERLKNPGQNSYTAKLLAAGTQRMAQKVGEEGVELALAATAGKRNEIVDEAADLIYHVIVLLADQGVSLTDVADRLESRHSGKSGEP